MKSYVPYQTACGGCQQTATQKNISKTAKIRITDNDELATRHLCGSCNNNSSSNNLWPKSNKNNNSKNNNKISSPNQLRLLLITMTVLMAFLQLPATVTAAPAAETVIRIKDLRHLHHGIAAAAAADTNSDSDSSDSGSVDDIIEFIIENNDDSYEEDNTSMLNKRSRLRKRHSEDSYLQHHREESETDLEWSNPCGGTWDPESAESGSKVPPPSVYLRKLRQLTNTEFYMVNDTQHIDISDVRDTWRKYRPYYSYLPMLNRTSNEKQAKQNYIRPSIALKTWYRHMQVYVASFAYLGRAQQNWDQNKNMAPSDVSKELNELLMSARNVLCKIETTINGSYPFPRNQAKLTSITRAQMNNKLRFLTKDRMIAQPNTLIEPIMLDLQFVKFKYFYYLKRMRHILHVVSKRRGQRKSHELNASAMTEDNSNSSGVYDMSISESQSSSSSSESTEHALQNRSQANQHRRRSKKHGRKQHQANRKSAELSQ